MKKQRLLSKNWPLSLSNGGGSMAYIRVNHRTLKQAAGKIDTCVAHIKQKMKLAQGEVHQLNSFWKGKDAQAVQGHWEKIAASDSTTGKMNQAMESYADHLRSAANQYRQAQIRAIERANRLPRF